MTCFLVLNQNFQSLLAFQSVKTDGFSVKMIDYQSEVTDTKSRTQSLNGIIKNSDSDLECHKESTEYK